MYPIERFLCLLKCYVRNKNQPEGSIAEGSIAERYIVEESLIFCSRYLHGTAKGHNRMDKNYEVDRAETYSGLLIFEKKGSSLLRDTSRDLEEFEGKQAHLYVWRNGEIVKKFNQFHGMFC